MRRYAKGEYGTLDRKYRVVCNWGDTGNRAWTVLFMHANGDAEVLDTWGTLREARAHLASLGAS